MMKLKFLILLIFISNSVFSKDENRGWFGVFSRKPSENKEYFTHQELQMRYDFQRGESQQLLARFGILKPMSNTQEVGLLIGLIETGALIEYRPTLHYLFTKKGENFNLGFRSRLEWRDWQNSNINSVRTRFQLSIVKQISSKFSILIWDEPFINLTNDSMSGERTFDRNRAFIGLRHSLWGHQLEIGYLNQFVPRKRDLTEHVVVTYLYF